MAWHKADVNSGAEEEDPFENGNGYRHLSVMHCTVGRDKEASCKVCYPETKLQGGDNRDNGDAKKQISEVLTGRQRAATSATILIFQQTPIKEDD